MSISAICPSCSRQYKLKDEMAGKSFSCKDCGEKIRVGKSGTAEQSKLRSQGDETADLDPWSSPLPPRKRPATTAARRETSKPSRIPLIAGICAGVAIIAIAIVAVVIFRKGDESIPLSGGSSSIAPEKGATAAGTTSTGTAANAGVSASSSSSIASGFPLEPDAVPVVWGSVPNITLSAGADFAFPQAPTPVLAVKTLVSGSYSVATWNLASGEQIGQVNGLPISVGQSCISPDGMVMATLDGPRKNVEIWSFASGQKSTLIPVEQGSALVNSMACLSAHRVLTYTLTQVGGNFTKVLKLFNTSNGDLIKSQTLQDPADLNSVTVSFGGKYFATTEFQKGTRIFRSETLDVVATIPAPSLNFATPAGAAFNASGDKLSMVWTDPSSTLVSTISLTTGKITETKIAGDLKMSPITGDIYIGPGIEWLPDSSGWLLFGRTIVDAGTGLRVWTIDTSGLNGTRRRSVVNDGLLVYTGGFNLVTQKNSLPALKLIPIPIDEVTRSLAALAAKTDARLRPGTTIAIRVDVGELKHGTPEETRTELEKAFQNRLTADGMVIGSTPVAELHVTYAEADGQQMFQQDRRNPGLPRQPQPPPTGASIQSTVASIKLALQFTGDTQSVWTADLLINPSVLFIRGNATAASARDAMFQAAQWQITAAPIPYFIPKDNAIPALPGQTIYDGN